MKGWERDQTFDKTGLEWVPTSPHIPQYTSAFYYPATGIIGELDPNMIGIGYTLPFQTLVTENIDADRLSDSLNALQLKGVLFRPIYLKPYYMARKGVPMQGVQIYINDLVNAGLTEIQFFFLQEAHRIDPNFNPFRGKEDRYAMFDKVCGSDLMRKFMMEDFNFENLRSYWNSDRKAFLSLSEKYYLY